MAYTLNNGEKTLFKSKSANTVEPNKWETNVCKKFPLSLRSGMPNRKGNAGRSCFTSVVLNQGGRDKTKI